MHKYLVDKTIYICILMEKKLNYKIQLPLVENKEYMLFLMIILLMKLNKNKVLILENLKMKLID